MICDAGSVNNLELVDNFGYTCSFPRKFCRLNPVFSPPNFASEQNTTLCDRHANCTELIYVFLKKVV